MENELIDDEMENVEIYEELYRLSLACKETLDIINNAKENKDLTTLKSLYYRCMTKFNLSVTDVVVEYVTKGKFTESPIETLFYDTFDFIKKRDNIYNCFLQPQVKIGKYRVDFELVNNYKKIVVECDGYEFHEKTKQQVNKDKKRERDLQKLGYQVIRFSGSEIFNNSEECVEELLEIMKKEK